MVYSEKPATRWAGPPRSRLDAHVEVDYVQRIFAAGARKQLDDLTQEIWRTYGRGEGGNRNAPGLERVKRVILARRVIIDRNDPR